MDDNEQRQRNIGIATLLPLPDRLALVRAAQLARTLPEGVERKRTIDKAIERAKAANPRFFKKGHGLR